MRVSVLTCTHGRERRLPGLFQVFDGQTHADKELIVFDDSASPSPYLSNLKDPRVRYVHSSTPVLMGDKRNHLVAMATGEVIAFFDDDDYYRPHYLSSMLADLGDADIAKLVAWYNINAFDGELFFWDTRAISSIHFELREGAPRARAGVSLPKDFVQKNLDGFGFGFVIRKRVFSTLQFVSQNFHEDTLFVTEARARGLDVRDVVDRDARVLHVVHPRTTSVVFPQYRLPEATREALFPAFPRYVEAVGGL
jgi:glycosyltransferase involved in cell wall biosynthesis